MLTLRSSIVLLSVVLALPGHATDLAQLAGPARAVDGDTLEIGAERVRIFGVDAPEHDQSCIAQGAEWDCGAYARKALAKLVAGQEVACTGTGRDRYDRLLARCEVGGADVGASLVAAGAAMAYVRYSRDYLGEEKAARAAGLGIWRGTLEAPESFRHDRQVVVAQAVPGDCAIKGNISGNGHIYHVPGQEHYAETRIDPKRGEAWFCTEAEARAAGFRKARQ
ncbi:thermonuclease family protein [Neotabrizicola shimadae]|uniref:Thermonuclease family protein n=1 Tax=Neotabrizicola shimadae TaxID=2807096 RepID=A0A8G0ZZD3_9RHOB|nr:thermonuclease family protein [Neotabrizicola shimadae]